VKHANRPSTTRSAVRFVSWCVLGVLACLAAIIVGGSKAHAATGPETGIPFFDVCPNDAPYPALPTQGLPGQVGERPLKVTNDNDPAHIWSTGGFGGLQSHPYDLGCALDPSSWMKITSANTDASISNGIVGVAQTGTSLTDSMDRRAWQPGYVTSFLRSFAARMIDVVQVKVLIPLLGLGIAIAAGMTLWAHRRGNVSGAAHNLGWVAFVLLVTTMILSAPLGLSMWTQDAGNAVSATLNNNVNASDGATNATVKAVHYQGWLRRTFGAERSSTAETYGMDILSSQRLTWTEYDQANRLKGKVRGQYVKDLVKAKSKKFKDTAKKIKEADPIAYKHLTGEIPGSAMTPVEVGFSLGNSAFRLVVDYLVIMCVLVLLVLAVLWVAATPYLVTPRGEQMGRGLIDNGVRAIVYVGEAALATWGFTIWLDAAMAPGMSAWWSLLLLLIGVSIFWIALSPMHKIGSLMSLGHMNGSGKLMGFIKTAAMAYVTGNIAGAVAGKKVAEEIVPEKSEDAPSVPVPPPAPPVVPVVKAKIYNPGEAPQMWSREEHFPDADRTLPVGGPDPLPSGAPAGEQFYQRTDPDGTTVPPPEDATTAPDEPFEPYQRTDDNDSEGADSGRA
jgi:hypothetical protein